MCNVLLDKFEKQHLEHLFYATVKDISNLSDEFKTTAIEMIHTALIDFKQSFSIHIQPYDVDAIFSHIESEHFVKHNKKIFENLNFFIDVNFNKQDIHFIINIQDFSNNNSKDIKIKERIYSDAQQFINNTFNTTVKLCHQEFHKLWNFINEVSFMCANKGGMYYD